MKAIRCDVCGRIMGAHEVDAAYSDRPIYRSGVLGTLMNGKDVCCKCIFVGDGIDFGLEMLRCWGERVLEAGDDE